MRLAVRALLLSLTITACVVAPASAQEADESFSTTVSSTAAGGHPDITTSFQLASPGAPEAARQVVERLLLPEDAQRAVEAAKQGKLAKLGQ